MIAVTADDTRMTPDIPLAKHQRNNSAALLITNIHNGIQLLSYATISNRIIRFAIIYASNIKAFMFNA